MSADLFEFEWPVDQAGYEVRRMGGDGPSLLEAVVYDVVKGRGGPRRDYRPLAKHPGLWLQFSEGCRDAGGVIEFANRFGLIDESGHLQYFIDSANLIRLMKSKLDQENRPAAAEIFNKHARPRLTAGIRPGSLKVDVVPLTLGGALFLQAMKAITGTTEFRRCRNCPTWFPYGPGTGATARRSSAPIAAASPSTDAWSRRRLRLFSRT